MAELNSLPPGRYQGTTLRRAKAAGYALRESSYEERARFARHSHEGAFAYLVLEGICVETRGAVESSNRAHSLVFHAAGQSHATEWPSGGRCFHITLSPERWQNWTKEGKLKHQASLATSNAAVLGMRVFAEFRRPDAYSSAAIEALMTQLWIELARGGSRAQHAEFQKTVRELESHIRSEPARDWGVLHLAELAGLEPDQAARAFRRTTGLAFSEYLRRERIQLALEEIARGDRPLGEIALAVGFYDQSHFSRSFKQLMGLTLREYKAHLL